MQRRMERGSVGGTGMRISMHMNFELLLRAQSVVAALVLGTDWINDICVQHACIDFIHYLLSVREQLLQSLPTSSTSAQT